MNGPLDIKKILGNPEFKGFLELVREIVVSPFTQEEQEKYGDTEFFNITIAYKGHGLWVLRNRTQTLNHEGKWSFYEPTATEQQTGIITGNRFTLEEAYYLAQEHCQKFRLFNLSPEEYKVWADAKISELNQKL